MYASRPTTSWVLLNDECVLQEHPFWFYDVLRRFDIPARVPLNGSITYATLAAAVGIKPCILRSILRYAMAYHVFAERPPQHVSHTPASRLLATDASVLDLTSFTLDEIIRPALSSASALYMWPDADNPAQTAFMLGERSAAPHYWAHLAQDSARSARFARIMAQGTARECAILADNYPWTNYSTLVEMGGSRGEFAAQLAARFPNLNITVQDLPHIVTMPETTVPTSHRSIQLSAHDFFDEQPIRNADVYLYRHCFHNWNDQACVRMLHALLPALKDDARVLLVDAILPEPGEIPLRHERMIRCQLPLSRVLVVLT